MADFLLFFLIIYSFIKNKKLEKEERIIKNVIVLYILIVTFSYIVNYQNILYFIGGFRNVFRFFFFFLLCTIYLTKSDMLDFLNQLDGIFYINAVIMMIQYFVFD